MPENGNPAKAPGGGTARVPVFDFGGVLFDWNPRYLFGRFFPGDDEGMERFLREIDFWNWNAEMDRGRPFAEGVADWSAKFPRYAECIRAFDSDWESTVRGPMPGMPRLLRQLRRAGVPLYGLSNTSAEKFSGLRRRFPFLDGFAFILLSAEAGANKPDPLIYEMFLERAGRGTEELLLIDDAEINLTAARTLGWDAVRFASAELLERDLTARGVL
jgi:2-haloacid dehalogenase